MEIKIKRMSKDARLPEKAYPHDAGWDCFIASFKWGLTEKISVQLDYIDTKNCYPLHPRERVLCQLGFATQFDANYYCQIVPRSGLALRYGVIPVIGTIDAGYRGEWGAIIVNCSEDIYRLRIGEKICQFVVHPILDCNLCETKDLDGSVSSGDLNARGANGFGSSGK